jgi:hypothetical protein
MLHRKGTISTKSSQICAYADDVVIVSGSETRLRQLYRETEEKPQQTGLIVNEKKTKYMIVSAIQKGRQTQNWKVGDNEFERASSFKCLGNVINKVGRISECVKDRIQAGNRAHAAKHHMLQSTIIKRSVKMQI